MKILVGIFLIFLMLAMFLVTLLPVEAGSPKLSLGEVLPALVWYAVLGVISIGLGIGLIRARRWARALSLIQAWLGLILSLSTGFIFVLCMLVNGSAILPDHAKTIPHFDTIIAMGTGFGFSLLLGVWPLIGVLFYGGKQVKTTCEAYSPVAWTDRQPLPTLAASICIVVGSIFLLFVLIGAPISAINPAPPTFWVKDIICSVLIAVGLFSAWQIYRLKVSGWWIQFTIASIILIILVVDLIHDGIQSGPNQLFNLVFASPIVLALLPVVFCLGYLLWIKRFFNRVKTEKNPELS